MCVEGPKAVGDWSRGISGNAGGDEVKMVEAYRSGDLWQTLDYPVSGMGRSYLKG
jgi:hypothetical protein